MPIKTDDTSAMELPENTVDVEDHSANSTRRRHTHRSKSAENTLNSVLIFVIYSRNDDKDISALFNCSRFVIVAYVFDYISLSDIMRNTVAYISQLSVCTIIC